MEDSKKLRSNEAPGGHLSSIYLSVCSSQTFGQMDGEDGPAPPLAAT